MMGPDYRGMGPFTACPVCAHGEAWIVVAVDEASLELAWYGLDAMCFSCHARYKLACPTDRIIVEPNAVKGETPPVD